MLSKQNRNHRTSLIRFYLLFLLFQTTVATQIVTNLDGDRSVEMIINANGQDGFTFHSTEQSIFHQLPKEKDLHDLNGDGRGDLIFTASNNPYDDLSIHVVFSPPTGFPANFTLSPSSFDGTNGFVISSSLKLPDPSLSFFYRYSISVADFNGDEMSDILVADLRAEPPHVRTDGLCVIFGRKTWPSSINLSQLKGKDGFKLTGYHENQKERGKTSYKFVDVNKDGYHDIVLIPPISDRKKSSRVGYVLYGNKGEWPPVVDIKEASRTRLVADETVDETDFEIESGDMNGDLRQDLILVGQRSIFVIYGPRELQREISYGSRSLTGSNGFTARCHSCLVGVGDFDGNGREDLIWILSYNYYVLRIFYGVSKAAPFYDLQNDLRGARQLEHKEKLRAKLAVGDFNGDGSSDVIVASKKESHMVLGHKRAAPELKIMPFSSLHKDVWVRLKHHAACYLPFPQELNGDGADDVVFFSFGSPALVLFGSQVL
eukprot:TRINITY_DN7933_c0_g1_i1.p1 TRINITY_DN7933_c0_g1~~TRINITY_DN7933_c0_g1_i1.p1  ORF type:complete len:488 (-),score=112.62 TRINITY_DN7933_c0_g1_i1:8-1471(-)